MIDQAPPAPDLGTGGDELTEAIIKLRRLKDRIDAVSTEVQALNDEAARVSLRIRELFDERKIENMRVEGAGLAYVNPLTAVHCPAAHREELYRWLHESNNDGLIERKVNDTALRKAIMEMIATGRGAEVPSYIKIEVVRRVQIRR